MTQRRVPGTSPSAGRARHRIGNAAPEAVPVVLIVPVAAMVCVFFCPARCAAVEEPPTTAVPAGSQISLSQVWPKIGQAPQSDIATIEFLVCPDQAAIERPRSFIMTLSNTGGRDTAGLSLTLNQAAVVANVFGTRLKSKPLKANQWVHVALTVNSKTVNKRARLWIDGQLVGETLVLEYWPRSFPVARMLSDKWNQGRVFSGRLGDVRISKTIRYTRAFVPPLSLPEDADSTMRLDGRRLPLE